MKKIVTLIITVLCAATLFAQAPEKFSYQAVVRNASNALVTNAPVGVQVSVLQGGVAGTLVYMETHTSVTNGNGLLTLAIGGGNLQQGDFASIDWADGPYFLKTEIDPAGGTNYSITSVQQLLSVPYALYSKEAGNGFSGDYNDLTNLPQIPQNVSELTNDAGYITMDSVPAIPTNVSAFTNDEGYLTGYTETDPEFNAWDKDYNDLSNRPEIPTVPENVSAFTNDAGYITMDSVPTIPTNVSAFTNDAGYLTSFTEQQILSISNDTIFLSGGSFVKLPAGFDGDYNSLSNKPDLFSGDYNDLTNPPTIPTIPTDVSVFNNDAGYITMDSVPTNVSAFSNDAGYITMDSVPTIPTNVSAFTNDAGYLTGYTETDPEFNAWDKDYNDLINQPTIPTVPENVSAFINDAGYITMDSVPSIPTNVSTFANDAGYITGYTETDPQFNAWDKDYNDLTNKPVNADFGHGIVRTNVNNPSGATDIAVTFTGYALMNGGVVSLGFTRNVPAGATLNINNKGAKMIRWKGTALTDGIIKAGDRCLFMYNSGNESYYLLANDRWGADIDALAAVARTGSYNDLSDKPEIPTVPTNVSAFTNDAGYLTGYTETDPEFNAWDKDYNDLINQPTIPTVPENVSAFINDAGYITMDSVPSIPTNVSTFANDAGYITGYTETDPQFNAWDKDYNDLTNRPDLFSGNYNDLTSKPNLANVAITGNYDDLINTPTIPTVPTNVSAFVNDAGYLTAIPDGIGGISIESDPVFSAWNKDYNDLINRPNLANVATTGNYNDLTNRPNIPDAQVNADWNATMGVAQILNKPNLFSGNYNDLTNRPTIPTVPTNVSAFTNDAGYITAADVPAQVNADWNATSGVARILNKPTIPTIPSNVSAFSNDAHYITNTGNTCENTIDLCNLLNTIENLQNQVQELANMAGGSPYGTASNDTCPRHIVMIDGNPNACYFGSNTLNITLIAWIDGDVDMDATYTWYESGQSLDGHSNYLMGSWEPTYNNPYIFTVEVTQSDGCSYLSAPFEVNVYDKPYATITGSDNEICAGESVSLRANLQNYNDPMITFQWYENQEDNSHALPGRTHETEAFTPASTTDYIVKVTHLMNYGYESCVAYDTFRVEVTECDTAGGNVSAVIDEKSCPAAPTVTDIDGNTYNTVQIGGQCWMRENLRTTRYADGTSISAGESATSSYTPYYYNYSISNVPLEKRGLLYNWAAVMHGQTSSTTNPSGVQGICPDGWHVPSNAEWLELEKHVGSQSQYRCDNNSSYIAKALADTIGWETNDNDVCSVGNNLNNNNTSGFSALPGGHSNYATSEISGNVAYFWTATECGLNAYYHSFSSYGKEVYSHISAKDHGYSIRCLSDENNFSSPNLPSVTTDTIVSFSDSSATCQSTVISIGNSEVTERGICWSIMQRPTLGDSHTSDGNGTGTFTSNISGLVSNLTYYVRAYATNSFGTVYGNEVSFTTPVYWEGDEKSCPDVPTVTDIDGNVYNTVLIGSQCWMRENLKTTRYADGSNINLNSSYTPSTPYGQLYNWPSIMHNATSSDATPSGVQGICPIGWHVPSDAEWAQLMDFVGGQSEFVCGSDHNYIAKALSSTRDWESSTKFCAVGKDPDINNATGFSALPAGFNGESYNGVLYWSSTESSNKTAWHYSIYYNSATLSRSTTGKQNGFSVRCIHDEAQSLYYPTVITNSVSDIATTSAVCGGNISNGNMEITAKGVCWSTAHNPSLSDNYTNVGGSIGNFTTNITGLASNITYFVRAYASNQYGTVYGNEVSFTTSVNSNGDEQSCQGTPTLTDIDGNVYNTIQIGNQCWMRENLRVSHYADGTAIYGYYPSDDTAYKQSYGLLYRWYTMMGNASSSNANPSGVQGICPAGWHVPSSAEWSQLIDYVSSQSQYWCNGDSTHIAKALAFNSSWISDTKTCAVGYNQQTNNSLGFGALPAGGDGGLYGFGANAYFWSCTDTSNGYPYYRILSYFNVSCYNSNDKTSSSRMSVRCLRDPDDGAGTGSDTTQTNSHTISVSLTTDRWASETTWQVEDVSTNTVLASGGPYTNLNNSGTTVQSIPDITVDGTGCYVFTINDSYGDGICCSYGDGSYSVSYDGMVMGSGGNTFSKASYILNPASSTCPSDEIALTSLDVNSNQIRNAYFTVSGTVTNNGVNPVTSYKVKYRIDGGTWTAIYTESCNIATGETSSFTHNVFTAIPTTGQHTLEVVVSEPNGLTDNVTDNTLTLALLVSELPSGDAQPCPNATTVTDIDGHVYNTVKLGSQCWMASNLRTTRYADGTFIAQGSGNSTTTAYRYMPDNNEDNLPTYGYLYNWLAVMYGASGSSANPSGVQGVCPNGWHVPSNAEWNQLTNYLMNEGGYTCGSGGNSIAKALASTTGWNCSSVTCAIGSTPINNNSTGFGVYASGYYNGGTISMGVYSYLWSTTEYGDNVISRGFCSEYAFVPQITNTMKQMGHPVRCLRD